MSRSWRKRYRASNAYCPHTDRPRLDVDGYYLCNTCARRRNRTTRERDLRARMIARIFELEKRAGWIVKINPTDPELVGLRRRSLAILRRLWRMPGGWSSAECREADAGRWVDRSSPSPHLERWPAVDAVCDICGGEAHQEGIRVRIPRMGAQTVCKSPECRAAASVKLAGQLRRKYPQTEWRIAL